MLLAMLAAANNASPELDPPDADTVYTNYLRTCARLGVTPMPRERAIELIREWATEFAHGGKPLN